MLLAMSAADAAITCKYIPGMCPADKDWDRDPPRSASVPEPATLALLTTGFAAAGFAAWKRRKSKD